MSGPEPQLPVIQHPAGGVMLEGHRQTLILRQPPEAVIQWHKDGLPLPGATNAALVIQYPLEGDAGTYHATVSIGEFRLSTRRVSLSFEPLARLYVDGVEITGPIPALRDKAVEIKPWSTTQAVRYTLDGSEPTEASSAYAGPIKCRGGHTLRLLVGSLEAESRPIRYDRPRQGAD
jgi:hypothetical protein